MTRTLRIVLPATAAAMLSACGATPEQHLANAKDSFAHHQFNAARLELLAALDGKAGQPEALTMLARAQIELGDGDAALVTLSKLAVLNALPPDGAVLRGEAQLLRGRYADAVSAVEGSPTAEASRVRALASIKQGDDAAAEREFALGRIAPGAKARLLGEYARFALRRGYVRLAETLLADAEREGGAVLEVKLARAQVASAQGRLAQALAAYESAAQVYPENRAVLVGRIATLGELGRTAEMKPLLAAASKQSPDDPALAYLQARLSAANRDWKAVHAQLQPIEREFAALPEAELLYGQSLVELGQHEQAMAHIRAFLRGNPGHRLARRLLAQSQLASGDAQGAFATLQPITALPDVTPQELALAAESAKAAGRPDAAALAVRAQFPEPRMLAGEFAAADAALKRQDWQGAAQSYRRLLAVTKGDSVMLLNNAAYAEGKLGNHQRAIELALTALAKAPDNASVLDTAGWLLVDSGSDRARGLSLLQEAARLDPANRTIASHLESARG